MTSIPYLSNAHEPRQPQVLKGSTATIASLSRRERHSQRGEKRRQKVAMVLGTVGGVGSVLAVKSAATAAALWAGSPALVVAGVGLAAVMATSGTLGYFKERSALRAAGKPVPAFHTKDLVKSMFTSKAALVAGGMTAMAAALPGALMLVAGSSVAALVTGLHEYGSRRASMRARGLYVGRLSVRDALHTVLKSKSAGVAFLVSAGIGSLLSVLTGTSLGLPAAETGSRLSEGRITTFNEAATFDTVADIALTPALAPEPPMPMPEMVERPVVETAINTSALIDEVVPVAAVDMTPTSIATLTPAEPPMPEMVERPVVDAAPEQYAVEKAEPPAAPKAAAPSVAPTPVEPPAAPKVVAPSVAPAPAEPVVSSVAPHEVLSDTTGPDGVRQIVYGSGITETIYPADYEGEISKNLTAFLEKQAAASAASASGTPASAVPASADVPEAGKLPPVGECLISETDTEVRIDCTIDTKAEISPGAGIDFRSAANPEKIYHAGISADSDAINAGEFLEDHAVPAAQSAYEKGYFKPQMN